MTCERLGTWSVVTCAAWWLFAESAVAQSETQAGESVDDRSGVTSRGVVAATSGENASTLPGPVDVCITPSQPGPTPVPYPSLGTAVTELGEGSYKVAGGGELLVKKTTVASSSGDEAGAAQQAPKVQSAPLVFVGEPARLATATRSAASSSGTPADRGTGEPLVASFSGDPRFITEDPAAFELASMPAASTQRAASDASRNAADTSSTRESAVVSRAAPNVEARIVELEDGTLCLVCVRDGAVSAIYKLRRRPTAR